MAWGNAFRTEPGYGKSVEFKDSMETLQANVMMELRRLGERRRNLIQCDKVLKLTSLPRSNTLRQSRG